MLTQQDGESWYAFVARVRKRFRQLAHRLPASDRLALLKRFAMIRVTDWGTKSRDSITKRRTKVRARKAVGPVRPCFVCCAPARLRHHVMQVQYGGGNDAANKVPICDTCHADVHPWLGR